MPIFDYKCPSCNHQQESLVKTFYDVVKCAQCQTEMERQLSAPGRFFIEGGGVVGSNICSTHKLRS